jgi:hypothetical protein
LARDVETISKVGLMQEEPVVVTGGNSLGSLDKQTSISECLEGGVMRVVYVVAFLIPKGFQHSPRCLYDEMIPEMKTDLEGNMQSTWGFSEQIHMHIRDPGRHKIALLAPFPGQYHHGTVRGYKGHVSPGGERRDIAELARYLQPQIFVSFWSTTSHSTWWDIPTRVRPVSEGQADFSGRRLASGRDGNGEREAQD